MAASAESLEKAQEVAAQVSLPIAFGVTKRESDLFGAWWEDRRQIVQPSDFILDDAGQVLSATYSSGPVGRLEPDDAIRFIEFKIRQKAAG